MFRPLVAIVLLLGTPAYARTELLRSTIIRFRRDRAGQVVGFDYSNPVVRNIKFTRLGDGAK